jgi:superfamily II DNA or RNA helicase
MLKLYPHQKTAVDNTLRLWSAGTRHALGVGATGVGKTVIFNAVLDTDMQPGDRAVIIAHTRRLVTQAADTIRKWFPELGEPGLIQGGQRDLDRKVTICTVQSLDGGTLEALSANGRITHLITDEAHRSVALGHWKVIEWLENAHDGLKHLGVTATPIRTDKRSLGGVYDALAFEIGIKWLVENGWLVKPQEICFQPIGNVSRLPQAKNGWELVYEKWNQYASDRLTLGFTTTIQEAKDAALYFRRQGVTALAIYGTMPDDKQDLIIDSFLAGRLRVIFSAAMFIEGFNAPLASCLINTRPTRSQLLFTQIVGRVLRKHKGKQDALILNFGPTAEQSLVTVGDILGPGYEHPAAAGERAMYQYALRKQQGQDQQQRPVTAVTPPPMTGGKIDIREFRRYLLERQRQIYGG